MRKANTLTIGRNIKRFAGLPVVEFSTERAADVADPSAVAWRLSVDYDDPQERFAGLFAELLDTVGAESLRAVVFGAWNEPWDRAAPVELLEEAADRLTNLRALFVGEMTGEECEISWIQPADVTPLLTAFPGLEVLRVRGGAGLRSVRHGSLRKLIFESGGLPGEVVRAVGGCDLPALRHLELWLGVDEYGGDATVEDLAGILGGARLPALRYLGLRDAEIADEVAAALASAPVVARLRKLDLSMGILSDAGAEALLAGQPLTHLRRLTLRHHYLSPEMAQRIVAELPGVDVDVSERQEADDDGDRYVAVSE